MQLEAVHQSPTMSLQVALATSVFTGMHEQDVLAIGHVFPKGLEVVKGASSRNAVDAISCIMSVAASRKCSSSSTPPSSSRSGRLDEACREGDGRRDP